MAQGIDIALDGVDPMLHHPQQLRAYGNLPGLPTLDIKEHRCTATVPAK